MRSSLALLVALSSCLASPSQKAVTPTGPAGGVPVETKTEVPLPTEPAAQEDELSRLEASIDGDLANLGLIPLSENDPPLAAAKPLDRTTVGEATATVPEKEKRGLFRGRERKDEEIEGASSDGDLCTKSCEVADSICDAAERICQIADRMPPDSGAGGRCERARRECSRAREQVLACGCS